MAELKEILLGMLVLIYGVMFYIIGRTNFIEKVLIKKINELIGDKTNDDNNEKGGGE